MIFRNRPLFALVLVIAGLLGWLTIGTPPAYAQKKNLSDDLASKIQDLQLQYDILRVQQDLDFTSRVTKFFKDKIDEIKTADDNHDKDLEAEKARIDKLMGVTEEDKKILKDGAEKRFAAAKQKRRQDLNYFLQFLNSGVGPVLVPVVPQVMPCPPATQRFLPRRVGAAQGGPQGAQVHGRGFVVPKDFQAVRQRLNATRDSARLAVHKLRLANLPDEFDARNNLAGGTALPIQDQLQCGSCWIFGTVAAYEFNFLYKNVGQSVNASEQYILNCINTVPDPCRGASPEDAARFLKGLGTASRTEVGYVGFQQNCAGTIRFTADNYAYLDVQRDIPLDDEIKAAILTYGAVVVGIHAGEQGSNFQNYRGGPFTNGDAGDVDHAVALVGWKKINGDTYWILRNSWGTSWGDNGYMYILPRTNQVGFGAMWVSAAPGSGPPDTPVTVSPLTDRINYWKQKYPQYVP
jgi:hypothetical protein